MRLKSDFDETYLYERVNYYNKISQNNLKDPVMKVADFKYIVSKTKRKYASSYFFDSFEYIRLFPGDMKFVFEFGDIRWNFETPSITKSRPVEKGNENNVLLKLDKSRHFIFVKDKTDFAKKKNQLIGRSAIWQNNRKIFMRKYFKSPICNLGAVNKNCENPKWFVKPIGIDEHLKYKFILSLEGNDVATNLKWIMSSNSIAVMPKPTVETWFMEGKLVGGIHYIEIKDDYSDLEEKLNYYIANEKEARSIIENANKWVSQFQNNQREDLLSVLVLEKYLRETRQI
jgi:hypothetical protein